MKLGFGKGHETSASTSFCDTGAQVFINKGTNGRWTDTLMPEDVAEYEARAVAELGPEAAHWLATGEGP